MINVTNLNKGRLARLSLVPTLALAMAALSPFADAGTYSVTGVNWYPSNTPGTGTDGGYINFDPNNSLDVDYGLIKSISAPSGSANNVSASPHAMGNFEWVIRWTPSHPGDAPPSTVDCTVEVKGTATCQVQAVAYAQGSSSHATSSVSDPIFMFGSGASTTASWPDDPQTEDTRDSANDGANYKAEGATFTAVGDGTYEARLLMNVNSAASLSASGSQSGGFLPSLESSSSASVDLEAVMRLVTVDGQQVQTEL